MKPIADRQLKEIKKYLREKSIPAEVANPSSITKEYQEKLLIHLGFKISRLDGNHFLCKFPKGWQKVLPIGMREFCYLLDSRGRKRAAIFYKFMGGLTPEEAKKFKIPLEQIRAYKKVSSHINWMQRYRTKIDHVIPMSNDKDFDVMLYYNSPLIGRVMDSEVHVLYETVEMPVGGYSEEKRNEYFSAESSIRTTLFMECETWLTKKYSEHTNILKYWDDE